MTTNSEMQLKCLQIEDMVREMVVRGTTVNRELIEVVDYNFSPANEWEMEMFSEAILYAKFAVLN